MAVGGLGHRPPCWFVSLIIGKWEREEGEETAPVRRRWSAHPVIHSGIGCVYTHPKGELPRLIRPLLVVEVVLTRMKRVGCLPVAYSLAWPYFQ